MAGPKTTPEIPTIKSVTVGAIRDMVEQAEELNAAFLQGRTRIDEMADAITRSAAGVVRLGGSLSDVNITMSQIALGAKRNVIATEEQVSKLFAAHQLLGVTTETIVDNFAEVGINASQIGTNLEKSIEYVQSIGLNANVVMNSVVTNMAMMNRFSFSDGVEGLTKMAAQASMLSFSMSKTADFADSVMSPEKAIEAAAGFQRLGVNIGNLADPMAMINDALTDPGALQDSIIKAAQSFTSFDTSTQKFTINPGGILKMKELAAVVGMTAAELSKSALAAADLDRRVSMINPSIQFEKEEDKQFLANMATMEGGEFIVQLKDDETGIIERRKLSDITQEEFQKLRDKQDDAPKSLEAIQTSQLKYTENIAATGIAILAKMGYGFAGAAVVRGNVLGAERISREVTNTTYNTTPESATITDSLNRGFESITQLYSDKQSGKINDAELKAKILQIEGNIKNTAMSFGERGTETLANISRQAAEKITGNSQIEKAFREFALGDSKVVDKKDRTVNGEVGINGNINIKVDAPPGITEQYFKEFVESDGFKKVIWKAVQDMKTATGR